jgi:hypothetical protein
MFNILLNNFENIFFVFGDCMYYTCNLNVCSA